MSKYDWTGQPVTQIILFKMETENCVSEEPAAVPNLQIAQLKFTLTLPDYENDEEKKDELYNSIIKEDMAPYYEIVCKDLKWKMNKKVLKEMKERNKLALKTLDQAIEETSTGLGLTEIRLVYMNKVNYLTKIGDKENAIKTLSHAYDKTTALRYKLDNLYYCIRIGFFFMDFELIERNIKRAESLLEQGADWYSRNCFKVFKAIYSLIIRDMKSASESLINSISTFTCTEVISYERFIRYTLLSSLLTLNRIEIKQRLINNPDMQQTLHNDDVFREYLFSLYNCDYKLFFQRLADIEVFMKGDMFLNPHYRFYVREMKIKAYHQLLSTYISVNLSYMSQQFGVSQEYIENELSKLIAAGRLNYKIDKVSGIVVNCRRDGKTEVFQAVLKQGDLVLNRIHKLSRVINI